MIHWWMGKWEWWEVRRECMMNKWWVVRRGRRTERESVVLKGMGNDRHMIHWWTGGSGSGERYGEEGVWREWARMCSRIWYRYYELLCYLWEGVLSMRECVVDERVCYLWELMRGCVIGEIYLVRYIELVRYCGNLVKKAGSSEMQIVIDIRGCWTIRC